MGSTDWVTKDLLEKSLRKFHDDKDLQILGFSTKAAVPTGDNYTSDLFRTNVSYSRNNNEKKESVSLIIKVQPVGTAMEVLTKEMNLFTKEMEMFSKTFPLMYKALGPESNGCLSSLCFLTIEKPTAILVLEDLQPHGFKMVERQKGLDYKHASMVMKKIAQYHASSAVVVDKDPCAMKNYHNGIYTEDEILAPWLLKGFESLIESSMKWPGMETINAKLRKLGKNILRLGVISGDRRLGGFNVIIHGDLWINNMLFSYHPNGDLKDLKFVDFQLVKYTSPATDLHYFFTTSVTDEVRVKSLDNLLDIYYGQLLLSFSEMGYTLDSVPTRADFRKDFYSRGLYGVMAAATVLPLVKASHRDDATFEHLMTDEGPGCFREHCFTNDCYRNSMEIILPYYNKMGALD